MFLERADNALGKEKQHQDHQKASGKNVQLCKAKVSPKALVNGNKDNGTYHWAGYRTLSAQNAHEDQFRCYNDIKEDGRSQVCEVVTPKPACHTDE